MDPYDRLKAEMPEIAKAVNEFKSEQVQQLAFRALLRTLAGEASGSVDEDAADNEAGAGIVPVKRQRRRAVAKKPDASPGSRATTRAKVAAPTLDKTLNLRPAGAQSFKEFVAEKLPRDNNERNLASVYYLERIAGVTGVNVNQVYTGYKEASWRVPGNLRNALAVTASTKGWINTKNMDALTVTPAGENHIEHDLPAKPKA